MNPTIVHRKDHEGSLLIDGLTGQVLGHDKHGDAGKPDWAEGLTIASIAERHLFYSTRLGTLYTPEMVSPEVLAFEDLEWLGARALPEEQQYVNEHGETVAFELFTVDPDFEFRANVVATALGIAGDINLETGEIADAVTVAIEQDQYRSADEVAALEAEQQAGFKAVNE